MLPALIHLTNHPTCAMIGSGDLNEAFRKFAYHDLKDEAYLIDHRRGITIKSIIETDLMHQFEDTHKPTFGDLPMTETYSFRLSQLRESNTNPRLTDGYYELK